MSGLISLPATAWPDRNTAGDRAVLSCIARQFRISYPIESNYTSDTTIHWSSLLARLEGAGFLGVLQSQSGCSSISSSDFEAVQTQLGLEWTYVPTIATLISDLKSPYYGPSGSGSTVSSAISTINGDVRTTGHTVSVNPLEVTEDVLWIASAVPGPVGTLANIASASIALGQALDVNQMGVTPADVTGKGEDLGADLQMQYQTAIQGLNTERDILLSDWGRLQTAALNAMDSPDQAGGPNKTADWKWNSNIEQNADYRVELAADRLAYATLFPVRYQLYRAEAGTGSYNTQDITTYSCTLIKQVNIDGNLGWASQTWRPFLGSPGGGAVGLAVTGGGATTEAWPFAVPDSSLFTTPKRTGQYPTTSLLQALFVIHPSLAENVTATAPLFNPLQFALEAYANATSKTTTVTHQSASGGQYTTNNDCTSS
jgi:hypothetical protein